MEIKREKNNEYLKFTEGKGSGEIEKEDRGAKIRGCGESRMIFPNSFDDCSI